MRPAVLAALVAAFAAGCGSAEEEEVRAAVERYEQALDARDVRAICSVVLPEELARFDREKQLPEATEACIQAFDRGTLQKTGRVELEVEEVRVIGGRAEVRVRNERGQRLGLRLAEVADEWRIVRPE